jgi:hypothetical protein
MDTHSDNHGNGKGGNVGRWVFLGFALVAGYFLFTEHRAHLFGILPYLLILACPLMHLFHKHGGHGHGPQGSHPGAQAPDAKRDTNPGSSAPGRLDQ